MIRGLEQESWAEVKQLRRGFVPRFVRFTDKDGQVLSSDKRPDALADHFEHKQWGRVKTDAQKEIESCTPEFRNDLIFPEKAAIPTSPYTLAELKVVLKGQKQQSAGSR